MGSRVASLFQLSVQATTTATPFAPDWTMLLAQQRAQAMMTVPELPVRLTLVRLLVQ
jgi:hypothetical protein